MLKKPLQKYFGFKSFLKGQEDVIRKVLALGVPRNAGL